VASTDPPISHEQARALGDPTRHALFRYIGAAPGPVDVAELTEHVGLHHTAVRQHLAKLVSAGLVVEAVEHRAIRGRPKLRYALPPAAGPGGAAAYERLAVLLAEALRTGDEPVDVGRRAGRAVEVPAGGGVAAVEAEMARQGFEPTLRRKAGGRVDLVLGSCPFESAALANPDAVCALHLGLAEGVAEAAGGVEVEGLVVRDPRRAGCRLRLQPE
jgi:predicted ArsR family transcriptional regulator